jgi:cell fate regulator YaaT (PSP1 superfamily)
MIEKYHPKENTSSFLSNDLIDENYYHLVQDKITKELIETNGSNCCDTCEDNQPDVNKEPTDTRNIIIVKCSGLRGVHFCDNSKNHKLDLNDSIIVKSNNEYEFATVIETGQMVSYRRGKIENDEDVLPVVDRIANDNDNERNLTNLANSNEAKTIFLKLINELSLEMKLVDIHFQFDRKKLFFFYTSDGRVDFRELAKKLASNFKTRIELRQIGVRDEAKRIGGLATCGREYCCTSFLSCFKRITTDIAVENNISTSITKYTGPCNKLKCCLSFEI